MRAILLCILFSIFLEFAQGSYFEIVANPGFSSNKDVLYKGHYNKLSIINLPLKTKDLMARCRDFDIRDSNGFFYVFIPLTSKLEKTIIKFKENQALKWNDSFVFIIRDCR